MRDANPENLAFRRAIIIIIVDADGKANDIPRLGIANDVESYPEFCLVTGVAGDNQGVPGLVLAVTGVSCFLIPYRVVDRNHELAAGTDDVWVCPAGIPRGEVAVVAIDKNLHAVVHPGFAVLGFRLGAVLGEDVILHPDSDV